MKMQEYITLIGIGVSLIVSFSSLYFSFSNSKKTIFINSVTSSRAKWIETVRGTIAEFCGLSLQIFHGTSGEKFIKMDKIQHLRFLIKLQLNRNDAFDKSIMDLLDSIADKLYDIRKDEMEKEINKLINLTQDLLKLEWEGVKEESLKGNLNKRFKNKLYRKYLIDNEGKGNEI